MDYVCAILHSTPTFSLNLIWYMVHDAASLWTLRLDENTALEEHMLLEI